MLKVSKDFRYKFGYSQSLISMILHIYPRLKNYQHVDNLKNSPLLELARGENDTLREKLVKKALERKWKTNTIRTQATKFNAISNYLASLTNEEAMSGTLLSKLDENILLNFDVWVEK